MERRSFIQRIGGMSLGVSGLFAAGCVNLSRREEGASFKEIIQEPFNPDDPLMLPRGQLRKVLVIGGGIAGLSAALELAERGYQVEIREAGPRLGGRLHTRDEKLSVGNFRVEHGLHMWFHQYYVFKDILRRLGVWDKHFVPFNAVHYLFADYKPETVVSEGPYPANLMKMILSSPNLNLLNAAKTFGALPDIIFYSHDRNYDKFDNIGFVDWAKQTQVDRKFYDIIMEPAASVTLNDPQKISAAEMLLYMHFYFIGHPQAFHRHVANVDHATAVVDPWAARLGELGVKIRLNTPVGGLRFAESRCIGAVDDDDRFDQVIVACHVPGVRKIFSDSRGADAVSEALLQQLNERISKLRVAPPYHVLRAWFDRPTRADRPWEQAVIETPQFRPINLLGIFSMMEKESMDWAKATGGSVVEFHLYNTPEFQGMDGRSVWLRIRDQALRALPELAEAKVLDVSLGGFEDFSSFETGQGQIRPDYRFPRAVGVKNLALAGDWVAAPNFPCALMERAVLTGREAANLVLLGDHVRQVPVSGASKNGPGIMPQF